MKVSDILSAKGQKVRTISPEETAINAANRLRIENIGALVVSRDGRGIYGMLSERDIINGLAEHGSELPHLPVSRLMSRSVVTCAPGDSIAEISRIMTRRRVRHLPVLQDGQLAGIVSIGDVVKHRLDEVEMETNVLRDYAIARG